MKYTDGNIFAVEISHLPKWPDWWSPALFKVYPGAMTWKRFKDGSLCRMHKAKVYIKLVKSSTCGHSYLVAGVISLNTT